MENKTLEDPVLLGNILDIMRSQNALILSQQFAILSLFEQLGKAQLVDCGSATDRMRKLSFELLDIEDLDEVTLSLCIKILQMQGNDTPLPPDDRKVIPIGKGIKKT